MKKLSFLLILLFLQPLQTIADTDSLDVFSLINQRLSYMEDVAKYKAQHHLPVEDVQREILVLKKAIDQAQLLGLEPASIKDFFRVQMDMAKAIQFRARADWLSDASQLTQNGRNLSTEIRPQLLILGDKITQTIKDYLQSGHRFHNGFF
ncbi:MAG TPA: gamma subclass chorismate mutase AroQ [Porticoccus sp.]|nr:gamma subclass chorismate mutase AroQ [Porticoccus sp.]